MKSLTEIVEDIKIRKALKKVSVAHQIELYYLAVEEYQGEWPNFDLVKEIYKQYIKETEREGLK